MASYRGNLQLFLDRDSPRVRTKISFTILYIPTVSTVPTLSGRRKRKISLSNTVSALAYFAV